MYESATRIGQSIRPEPVIAVTSRRTVRVGAAVVVAAYMTLTVAPILVSASRGVASWYVAVVHLGVLAALLATLRADGTGRRGLLADWLPLAIVPLLYAELPLVMSGIMPDAVTRYHDGLIVGWELAMFGEPTRTLAAAAPSTALSELLHLSYFLYYPLIYLPPLLVYRYGDRATFHHAATVLVATFVVCFAVFVVFPVQGPRYFGGAPAPDGFMRTVVLGVLEGGSSRGAAFPSSHVAVAVAQVVLAVQRRSRLAPVIGIVTIGLSAGAVYGGFHYAVDIVAGTLVGGVIPLLWPQPPRNRVA